jgi:nucleoside 2-deoxyribosyltransferase
MINRLNGMRCYLIGAMDRTDDGGVQWREDIKEFLHTKGVVVLDPCDKPIDIGQEHIEDRSVRQTLKKSGQYNSLAKTMKTIRVIDLRMTDMADFVIVHIDTDVHACGTYEELFWANRLKNPVLIVCKQGKAQCPDWLFGVVPHRHIFDNFEQLREYLEYVAHSYSVYHMRRWTFFNYEKLKCPI